MIDVANIAKESFAKTLTNLLFSLGIKAAISEVYEDVSGADIEKIAKEIESIFQFLFVSRKKVHKRISPKLTSFSLGIKAAISEVYEDVSGADIEKIAKEIEYDRFFNFSHQKSNQMPFYLGIKAAISEVYEDVSGTDIEKIAKEIERGNSVTHVKLVSDKSIQTLKSHDKIVFYLKGKNKPSP